MTREIHIEYAPITKMHILYNGTKDEKKRKEFSNIADALSEIQEHHDRKKRYEFYLEGYTPQEKRSVSLVIKLIKAQFPNAEFPN